MSCHRVTVKANTDGMSLLSLLREQGIEISADCGGVGRCGKCKVKIIAGDVYLRGKSNERIAVEGTVKSCQTVCGKGECTVELLSDNTIAVEQPDVITHVAKTFNSTSGFGIALDVGTTTLAAALVNLADGNVVGTVSRLNPQRSFGADVMSRISASAIHLTEMRDLVRTAASEMIGELQLRYGVDSISKMSVTGNPTMIHLFRGVSPAGIGTYPFTPAFLTEQHDKGLNIGFDVGEVVFPAMASAFIGSDITAGVAVSNISDNELPVLFVDAGTNGEMVLYTGRRNGGRYYATSTAAGPALEGAGISCGTGGVEGAICAFEFDATAKDVDEAISFRTIGGKAPIGICGSGLVDLVAYLLDAGVIDSAGNMDSDQFEIPETSGLSLTRKDVRELQLAKGAICAGIDVLIDESQLNPADISRIFISGGLGYFINPSSAFRIGLLPSEFKSRITALGNTSLSGAVACVTNVELMNDLAKIAGTYNIIELNNNNSFSRKFVSRMNF